MPKELANQIKAIVCAHCVKIEIAGSIRRQKPKVHDIDFVVVAKSDDEWQKINEKLKQLKAKPNCSGQQRHKSLLCLAKMDFSKWISTVRYIDFWHSPACPNWFS